MFIEEPDTTVFKVGQRVRVKQSIRSPYSGCSGVLTGISRNDRYGTHLVCFNDGAQFRYTPDELKVLPGEFGISAEEQLAS